MAASPAQTADKETDAGLLRRCAHCRQSSRIGLIGGERIDAVPIGFFAENITELLRSLPKAEPKLISDGRTDDALLSAALRDDWDI